MQIKPCRVMGLRGLWVVYFTGKSRPWSDSLGLQGAGSCVCAKSVRGGKRSAQVPVGTYQIDGTNPL